LVGELLSRRSGTFALLWNIDKTGSVKVGLRSQRGYNCIPLAQSFGGGGHAQACGMRLPLAQLPELLAGTLTAKPVMAQAVATGDQT
jgi:nanoRNase/pAp phosphatase (c-di-AMP/oligoRNAs hydrolase)